jgi:hypothetical protein
MQLFHAEAGEKTEEQGKSPNMSRTKPKEVKGKSNKTQDAIHYAQNAAHPTLSVCQRNTK